MGTLSENQTQEHNKEEDRPGRQDLGAGATSTQGAQERLGGRLQDPKGSGSVTWQQRMSRPQSPRPSRSPEPMAAPAPVHQQAGLTADERAGAFLSWFGFLLPVCLPLPPPTCAPPPRAHCRGRGAEAQRPSALLERRCGHLVGGPGEAPFRSRPCFLEWRTVSCSSGPERYDR